MEGQRLYIDVDGVLVGKHDPRDTALVLARHAEELLRYSLEHFECFWLTSHCRYGDASRLLRHLKPLATPAEYQLLLQIEPTSWQTAKTDAIDLKSEFYWLDDRLLQFEIELLQRQGILYRWIHVDTMNEPGDLRRALTILKSIDTQGSEGG